MKVAEYRDLIRALQQIASDWHACASDAERQAWAVRAARVYSELQNTACTRATPRDVEMCELAQQQYHDLVNPRRQPDAQHSAPLPLSTSRTPYRRQDAGASRAAGYNKSPGRAVRLSRAARGAMRRGYV
jgi:hypothetical protein